jgi:urease gamma subunit
MLAYADDVRVGRSIDELKKTKQKVMKSEQVMGLNGQHAEDKRH